MLLSNNYYDGCRWASIVSEGGLVRVHYRDASGLIGYSLFQSKWKAREHLCSMGYLPQYKDGYGFGLMVKIVSILALTPRSRKRNSDAPAPVV